MAIEAFEDINSFPEGFKDGRNSFRSSVLPDGGNFKGHRRSIEGWDGIKRDFIDSSRVPMTNQVVSAISREMALKIEDWNVEMKEAGEKGRIVEGRGGSHNCYVGERWGREGKELCCATLWHYLRPPS